MKRLKLGVLASGGGTNLQAIIDRSIAGKLNADMVVIISNNSQSGALKRAHKHNIDSFHMSTFTEGDEDALDRALAQKLKDYNVDLVIFAGYMKKIGPVMIETFPGRILNIHPALLPKFGGKDMYGIRVHQAVLEAGEKESGVTVHVVDPLYDHGSILEQRKVPVLEDDNPEKLAARILVEEHKIYADVIQRLAEEWKE